MRERRRSATALLLCPLSALLQDRGSSKVCIAFYAGGRNPFQTTTIQKHPVSAASGTESMSFSFPALNSSPARAIPDRKYQTNFNLRASTALLHKLPDRYFLNRLRPVNMMGDDQLKSC